MEEESSVKLISVSDLLHRFRPITGASCLSVSRPIHRPTLHKHTTQPSHPQSPNAYKILKPLHYPTLLIGTLTLTLTLPSSSCSNSSCLKFSDHSAAVCCDILDLDLRVIGQRIRVVAWNFLPLKPHGGYLEIIRWTLDQSEKLSISKFNAFYLDSVFPAYEESIVPRHLIYGLLESVSPVTNVPCTAYKSGTRNLNGFLAEITICECKLCCSKDRPMSLQDITGEQNGGHNFSKSKILYFCGSASIWYPAISRLVGGVVLISGMKKKMVFLGEGKSLMMYVTTQKAMIHLPMSPSNRAMNGRNTTTRGKGLCGSCTGSITGVYMQGMVIELDQNVVLLLTDHQLSMPHSLRVGAIVTVRNFHLEDPKFLWTKVKVFGSCYKTSIRVNIFSPIESGCYQASGSRSLLRKFIESLEFSARLWVLLVVSSLRKKFAGVLSEIEILGSKHMEGLVQKYSSSCLPLSVFRFRHGVLTEYCQHELCGCGRELDYNPPKLVVPISNFISQCEDTFIKKLYASVTDSDMNNQYCNLFCGRKSHDQPIRKILKSEDMNVVLLGTLKISEYSGRLQLIDATGSIDIVIPDLSSVCSIKDIYEINNFSVVMEGFPRQLEHLESLNNEPLSCRNIFNHFQSAGRKRFTIYVYCYMRDAKSRNHILFPSMDREEDFKELESGRFHLLWLVHKFPEQRKFPGDDASNSSSTYAEAIVLPWNLVLHKRERDSVESYVGVSDAGSNLSNHLQCSYSDDQQSHNKKWCDLSRIQEFPCTIDCRISSDKSMVSSGILLNCAVANMQEGSSCKRAARKLLLEFKSDILKYELLRIGGYYLIKHYNKDLVSIAMDSGNTCDGKVFVNSKSHLWSVSFSADEAGPSTAQSCICSYHNLNVIDKEVQCPNSGPVEIPVLRSIDGCPEICPDICLHLSAEHLSLLNVKLRELKEDLIQPTNSIKGLFNSSWSPQTMTSASMLSGALGVNLPEGNLLSVQGHVVAVHSSDQGRLVTRLSHRVFSGARHHIIPGVTNSVCIHVLVGHNTVKIYSSLSERSYPIGFGPGIKANFYRVLLTAEGNVLKLTPASFIEINSIVVDDDLCSNEWDDTTVISVSETTSSLATGPAALISEMMQFPNHKQMRLHCKVVAINVLVMEKNNELLQSSAVNSEIPSVKFPIAGFIMDDGSSSCCCWTDSERAVTLLGLHEWLPRKHSRGSLHKSNKEIEIPHSYTMSRMSKILDQHGTVVLKGSVSDSSCLDVALLVNSDSVVSQSDEEFLKSLLLQACSSNTWNVVGTVLDTKAVNQLEERLQRLDTMMLPLQNIWASEVSHLDAVNEGRSILQELLKSK